jgi:hypothetical protein
MKGKPNFKQEAVNRDQLPGCVKMAWGIAGSIIQKITL